MTTLETLTPIEAARIVEQLRRGIPPRSGVRYYSVGYDNFIDGVRRRHLQGIENFGKIRFVSGKWGSGKTHFFSLLREAAFESNCLVSNVQLSQNEVPLNKFERVFYQIVRQVSTPMAASEDSLSSTSLFERVIQEALSFLSTGVHALPDYVTHEAFSKAVAPLYFDNSIDIDFKTIIRTYWETYLATDADPVVIAEKRARLLQWFSGEGKLADYRRDYQVNKMVDKTNAKLMLRSLVGFVRLVGYKGLVILFDEAETSYSTMRKSALKDAQNNLLTLINTIEEVPGLLLVYATTPDFYDDPKHGIKTYGALSGRIGQPGDYPPRALDTIWNLDQIVLDLPSHQRAAINVLNIYHRAFADVEGQLPTAEEACSFVSYIQEQHPRLSAISLWRILMASWVSYLDDRAEGRIRPTDEVYDDAMQRLRDD